MYVSIYLSLSLFIYLIPQLGLGRTTPWFSPDFFFYSNAPAVVTRLAGAGSGMPRVLEYVSKLNQVCCCYWDRYSNGYRRLPTLSAGTGSGVPCVREYISRFKQVCYGDGDGYGYGYP